MSKAAVVQMRGVRRIIEPATLTEADKLNGIEWKGDVTFYADAVREFRWEAAAYMVGGQVHKGWNDWATRTDPFARVGVVRVNGMWKPAPTGSEGWLVDLVKQSSDIAGHAIACDQVSRLSATESEGTSPAATDQKTQANVRVVSAKTDLSNILAAQEDYYSDQHTYAPDFATLKAKPGTTVGSLSVGPGNTAIVRGTSAGFTATVSNSSGTCSVQVGGGARSDVDGIILCSRQ